MVTNGSSGADARELSVLVVHVNFAVATAVAQRLLELSSVELARPRAAVAHLSAGRRYDAVVLCPYMPATDRERVLARCHSNPAPTTSIDLLDTEQGLRVEVSDCPAPPAPGVRVLRPMAPHPALSAVVDALRAPGKASHVR